VIVIGGGDTGTDCVATALRHGCRSLVQFEIMPQPPEQRAADNPWPQWPRVYKLDYGQAEAAAVFGDDPRAYSVQTTELLGDANGCLRGLRTVDVAWERSGDGRLAPRPVPGSEREWPAQMVILALGFLGPEGKLPANWERRRTAAPTWPRPMGATRRPRPTSLLPATPAAARASSSGPSTKGAARRGRWIAG
jgi:NADPH-dependent glutamate synthase beta subunit-like oxidoreductase